jgi:O-antigen ligase
MGATLAFVAGFTVAVTTIALNGHLALVIKTFVQLTIMVVIIGGVLVIIVSQNQRYQNHFERIFLGRAERSSEGRFYLWERGINAYHDNDVFLWGVGPENFREVDPARRDNQLHNDFLAFSVERGLLGSLGLALFAIVAVSRAAYMVRIATKHPDRASLVVVVFLAAMVTAMIESFTHQMFHFRELWVVLAFQEAMLFKMTTSESGVQPMTHLLNGPPDHRRGLLVQPDVTSG